MVYHLAQPIDKYRYPEYIIRTITNYMQIVLSAVGVATDSVRIHKIMKVCKRMKHSIL